MDFASGAGRRILVINRDARLRAELRELLEGWGFQVVDTERADSESHRYGAAAPAIQGVLLALHEAPSGLSLLEHMQRSYPGTPVIVVSDVTQIAIARQAVNLGAQEYVITPFAHELLKTKCLRIFAGSSNPSSEAEGRRSIEPGD